GGRTSNRTHRRSSSCGCLAPPRSCCRTSSPATSAARSTRPATSPRACPTTPADTAWALIRFVSSRRRHTRSKRDWSSDVCSSDLGNLPDISLPEEKKRGILKRIKSRFTRRLFPSLFFSGLALLAFSAFTFYPVYYVVFGRSEERRVGEGGRCGWSAENWLAKEWWM